MPRAEAGAHTAHVQCVGPWGKLPCASGTYGTQQAGTRTQYVQHGGPIMGVRVSMGRDGDEDDLGGAHGAVEVTREAQVARAAHLLRVRGRVRVRVRLRVRVRVVPALRTSSSSSCMPGSKNGSRPGGGREDLGWRVQGGGCRMEGGGWRVGWRVEGGAWSVERGSHLEEREEGLGLRLRLELRLGSVVRVRVRVKVEW